MKWIWSRAGRANWFWRHAGRIAVIIASVSIVLVLLLIWNGFVPLRIDLARLELMTRVMAFGAGALFVFYKVVTGVFLATTKLGLDITRVTRPDTPSDHLAVSVTIDRGPNGTIMLRDAFVRMSVLQPDGSWKEQGLTALHGTLRVIPIALRGGQWLVSDERPYLLLPPGDKTTFSAWLTAPRGSVCLVEAVVAGRTTLYWRSAQWRASMISFATTQPKKDSEL